MREYNVTITETLKMTVPVEAETQEEAEEIVKAEWQKGTYILDADNFIGAEFEVNEPIIELSYREMKDVFLHINKVGHERTCGYIVFAEDSFSQHYDETSRTYVVSSDNKAFIPGAGGNSIFASCLDGTDPNIRLDGYLHGEKAWKIERCYMHKEDYQHAISQPVLSGRQPESR